MKMKMTIEHFEHIKLEIDGVLASNEDAINMYETGKFYNASKTNDLNKRFCFDLFYAAGLTKYACDHLYNYLNDDHIYTALKAIVPKVTKKY